jgi:hypothetical protein
MDLNHEELVVISDVLRRVADGAREGTTDHLIAAAKFANKPEFATALEKLDDAVMATGPSKS